MRLKEKTAAISAAGAGIGFASARPVASEGASVTAVDVSADSLVPLAADGIATRQLDVADPEGVLALSRDVGAVDVLFHCVGFVNRGSVLDCGTEGFDF